MAVYIMANISIEDRDEYAKYEAGFLDVFARYDGELLAVTEEPEVVEGEWPWTRAVLIRFPSETAARSWYMSPEYQEIAQHRWRASTASVIVFEDRPAAT